MSDDRALEEALLRDNVVTPAMLAHAKLLLDVELGQVGGFTLGPTLVELGYLDEGVLADVLARLTGARLWDGKTFDAALFERTRLGCVVPIGIEGRTLHYATVDPRRVDEADTLRLETGARDLVPWIATHRGLEDVVSRLLDASHAREENLEPPRGARDREGALAHAAHGVVNRLLLGAVRTGVLRVVVGAGTLRVDHGPLQAAEPEPPAELAHAIVKRLRSMVALPEQRRELRQGRRFRLLLREKHPVAFDVYSCGTDIGETVYVERQRQILVMNAQLSELDSAATLARGGAPRERALRTLLAAADALDPADPLSQIMVRVNLAAHLLESRRADLAAAVAHEAYVRCEALAPAALIDVEALLVPARPRDERLAAWEDLADRAERRGAVLQAAGYLETALEYLDALSAPADAERVAVRLESLERRALGAAALGTLEALGSRAIASAARDEAAADELAARARVLARRLLSEPEATCAGDRILARVRAGQGRRAEAEALLRNAMRTYLSGGSDAGRWTAAVELSMLLPIERAQEIRDLCEGAMASATLSQPMHDRAAMVLERVKVPLAPYR